MKKLQESYIEMLKCEQDKKALDNKLKKIDEVISEMVGVSEDKEAIQVFKESYKVEDLKFKQLLYENRLKELKKVDFSSLTDNEKNNAIASIVLEGYNLHAFKGEGGKIFRETIEKCYEVLSGIVERSLYLDYEVENLNKLILKEEYLKIKHLMNNASHAIEGNKLSAQDVNALILSCVKQKNEEGVVSYELINKNTLKKYIVLAGYGKKQTTKPAETEPQEK